MIDRPTRNKSMMIENQCRSHNIGERLLFRRAFDALFHLILSKEFIRATSDHRQNW